MSNRTAVSAVWLALGLAALTLDAAGVPDANWPQWRGPQGLAVSSDTDLPTQWSPTTNISWKTAIPGRGHSSPTVWGDRIFLTTSVRGSQVPGRKAPVHLGFDFLPGYVHPDATDVDYRHTLKVLAINAATGRIAWERTAYDGLMFDDRHRKNTFASPTIATDGRLVFAFFESLGLYAYDFAGRLQWRADVGPIIKAGLGPGTSPVIHEDLVIVLCDQEMGTGSFIAAFDRATGRQRWRTERANRRSWATPLLVRAGARTELVTSGAESVIAYDPATGHELWRANGTQSHPIPSAVAGHGLVFVSAAARPGARSRFDLADPAI